jgi:MoxR-like ATPase
MKSDFQVSIPELGTLKAANRPVVVLTSNNTRPLSDALKRRCVYLFIDYPDVEKEIRIITAKVPGAAGRLGRDVAAAIAALRNHDRIFKKPSISETLDWVSALLALGKNGLDEEGMNSTLGFVLKNREDMDEFVRGGGLDEILGNKHS